MRRLLSILGVVFAVLILLLVWLTLRAGEQLPPPTVDPGTTTPSVTPTAVPTQTPVPPTQTAVLPTETPLPAATATETATAPPTETAVATPVPPTATAVAEWVVQFGDNLSDISEQVCGREQWRWLWEANRGIVRNPHLIFQGQRLRLPWPC